MILNSEHKTKIQKFGHVFVIQACKSGVVFEPYNVYVYAKEKVYVLNSQIEFNNFGIDLTSMSVMVGCLISLYPSNNFR